MLRKSNPAIPIAILALIFLSLPVSAQKVQTDFDKSADFSHYKRYTWGKNFIITRQLPQDQARIDKAIVDAIDRHLQAKGFVRDDEKPDFLVAYKSGGLSDIKMGAVVDISSPWGPAYASGTPSPLDIHGTSPVDVWAGIMANLLVVVADAQTNTAVWQALASKKLRDPKEAMKKLDKEVDQVVKKALKDFPPKRK